VISLIRILLLFYIFDIIIYCITNYFFHATGCVFSLLYLCKIWWGNLRERDHLEDPGVEGRIILRWNFRKWDGGKEGMDWIDLAEDRDMWWALENAATYFRAP